MPTEPEAALYAPREDEYLLFGQTHIRSTYSYGDTQIHLNLSSGRVGLGANMVTLPSGRKILVSERPDSRERAEALFYSYFEEGIGVFITLTGKNQVGTHEVVNFRVGDTVGNYRVAKVALVEELEPDLHLYQMTLECAGNGRTLYQLRYTGWQDEGLVVELGPNRFGEDADEKSVLKLLEDKDNTNQAFKHSSKCSKNFPSVSPLNLPIYS
jgi:hypothetical protein